VLAAGRGRFAAVVILEMVLDVRIASKLVSTSAYVSFIEYVQTVGPSNLNHD